MKTLYLCTAKLRRYSYLGEPAEDTVLRLVWAASSDEASHTFRNAYARDEVFDVDCTPALGTPTQEPA